jgi:hypothetical protein
MYKLPPLTMTCPTVPELLLRAGADEFIKVKPWNPSRSFTVKITLPVRPATEFTEFVKALTLFSIV